MKFQFRIKEMREERKYVQEYVADRLGVCRQTYGKIEQANDYTPLKYISELAAILECKEDDLFEIPTTNNFHSCSIVVAVNNGSLALTISKEQLEQLGLFQPSVSS